MKSIRRVLSILVVVVVAWSLRSRAVEMLPVDFDEDDYLRAAQEFAIGFRDGDLTVLREENYRPEHPALAKILYGLAITPLPEAELIPDLPTSATPNNDLPQSHLGRARSLSALFGSLEVLLLAIFSPLSGLLLGIHTFTIKYTSQVMLEGFPALSSAVSVVAYERWYRLRASDPRGRHGFWLVVSAVALGLTAASKYMYALVGLVILLSWVWRTAAMREHDRGVIKSSILPILSWGFLSIIVFFLTNPYLWSAPVERLTESLLYHGQYATGAEEVQRMNFAFWQPLVTLLQSVPWHPGVFVVMLDGLIALSALLGLRQAWRERSIYAVWIVVGLIFLFIWPTKWPQYILLITFPISFIAGKYIQVRIMRPLWEAILDLRDRGVTLPSVKTSVRERRETRQSIPWLLPGLIVLVAITFYPLFYQGAIALTDFNATSIRDGLSGGVGREVVAGFLGQAEPRDVDIFASQRGTSRQVHYTGFAPLLQIFGPGMSLLVFELIWTVLVVGMQLVLGLAAALLLHRQGVRLKGLWQTLLILPWAIPEFVGALIWMQIFDPRFGWFFLGAQSFGETPGFVYAQQLAGWQDNPNAALGVLLVAGVWLGFPLLMLAASAGLKMIPVEVYEAAALDGAGGWSLLRHVTWPLLLPLLTPALIIRGIYAFNQFYLFYVLNPPFPLLSFASVSYYFFHFGGQYAASAIVNLFTVVLLVIFLIGFNRTTRAGEGVTYA